MSNFFTKLTSTMGIVTLLAASTSVSLVSAASEFLPYAEVLAENSVIGTQSSEAEYRLGNNITRAELAKVVANLGDIAPTDCGGDIFSDVGAKLGDLCGYVEGLADAGVVSTASATFRPSANVTRAEMIKMILGSLGETPSTDDAGYTDLAGLGDLAGYINRANEIGCAATSSYFRPNASASRGEAFKIAACVAQLTTVPTEEVPGTTTGSTSTGTTSTGTVVTGGALSVSLDGTAMAQYVPKNASSVKVGSVKLTAADKDVTVRSLIVARSGLGNANDIVSSQGVRAAMSGTIVSSSSDYYNSTSQNGNVYFYPALVIKAGTSTSVDLLVSLSGAENSQHQFTLTSVATDGTVSGAPVTLGLLNTTSYVTSTVEMAGSYSYTATPGKTQQNIAKVDLTAGGRDVTVNGFTLTRSGSNDLTRKFTNVGVFKNGVKVGTAVLSADKLAVTGLATALASGNFQSFEIKADVLVDGSSSSNTLQFKLDTTSDVSAVEVATGYATQTINSGFLGTVTFANVDVTYVKTTTANQTVSPGASNVTLFAAKLSSTVPLTSRSLIITPQAGATSGALAFSNNQLSVKLNGSEIATITSSEFGSNSVTPITKTVSIPVDNTTPATITIVGSSIKNTSGVAGVYTFAVALSDVRDSANNAVTLITNTVTGDKTTIQSPTLTLKNATTAAPSTSTLSAVSSQEVARFGLTADSDAVRLTKVVLTGSVTANGATASGSALPTNTAIATYAIPASNGTNTHNGVTVSSGTVSWVVTYALSEIADASSIELWDADKNTKISATATVLGSVVTFDSMTNDILKDATQNLKIVFTSVKSLDAYYGKTLQFTLSNSDLTATTVNSSATVALAGSAAPKAYVIGVVPPTVLLTANSPLTQNAKLATLKVTNVDSNTGITLSGISLQFQARSTAQGGFTFSGAVCLRDLGSTASCGALGTTLAQSTTQAGGTYYVIIGGSQLSNASNTLTKNGGYAEYEVYLDNAPLWVAGDNANVTIKSIDYSVVGGSVANQSLIGVAGASATSTK